MQHRHPRQHLLQGSDAAIQPRPQRRHPHLAQPLRHQSRPGHRSPRETRQSPSGPQIKVKINPQTPVPLPRRHPGPDRSLRLVRQRLYSIGELREQFPDRDRVHHRHTADDVDVDIHVEYALRVLDPLQDEAADDPGVQQDRCH